MPQMTLAQGTRNRRPANPERRIGPRHHVLPRNRLRETRPPGPRIELRSRIEERRTTAHAMIYPIFVKVPERAGKRQFRIRPPRHLELIHRQTFPPLIV